ncbi:MAG TPA: hypothetical protein DCS23_02150 [Candidatus Yonathbacteria bacterium]|nr:hypothetical protein [Candidatus Yonathbacteria bacterium]
MKKEFDAWNSQKKNLGDSGKKAYAYPREVWWCALGVNVGAEVDGKNENFERPVLVVRVYNKETMLVLPITSKEKLDGFHYEIQIQAKNSKTEEEYTKPVWIKLTQARVISNNRLLRKVDTVNQSEFDRVVEAFRIYT